MEDALGEPSLRYHSVETVSGGPAGAARIDIVGDVNGLFGRQVITWDTDVGQGVATLELVSDQGAYFRASSASMLQHYFDFPASSARNLAGRWIEAGPADGSTFQALSAGLTVDTWVEALFETGRPYSAVTRTRVGSATLRVVHALLDVSPASGKKAPAIYEITTSSDNPLPASVAFEVSEGGLDISDVSTFSSWGEFNTVDPPTTAIPYKRAIEGTATL